MTPLKKVHFNVPSSSKKTHPCPTCHQPTTLPTQCGPCAALDDRINMRPALAPKTRVRSLSPQYIVRRESRSASPTTHARSPSPQRILIREESDEPSPIPGVRYVHHEPLVRLRNPSPRRYVRPDPRIRSVSPRPQNLPRYTVVREKETIGPDYHRKETWTKHTQYDPRSQPTS